MAYVSNTIISRPGYSGIGSWWGDIASSLGPALSAVGAAQAAKDAAANGGATTLTAEQQADIAAAQAARDSDHTMLYVGLGVAGLAAYLLLRKKKAK